LLLDSYKINIIILTSRLNYPEFQTTQESSVSRFIINRHKISEKGCLKNQFFKAQINQSVGIKENSQKSLLQIDRSAAAGATSMIQTVPLSSIGTIVVFTLLVCGLSITKSCGEKGILFSMIKLKMQKKSCKTMYIRHYSKIPLANEILKKIKFHEKRILYI
jgi:hypothetical protein